MDSIGQNMKDEFLLSIFDLDLLFQGQIGALKPSLY